MIKKDKIPPEERWRLPPGMNMNATVYGPPLLPEDRETEALDKKAEGKKKKRGFGWFRKNKRRSHHEKNN